MISDLRIELMNCNREHVLSLLADLQTKKNKDLRVIDIGGSANDWCPYTTHIVDMKEPQDKKKTFFPADLEAGDDWFFGLQPIMSDINMNGKFDFLICTHTLEDLSAPWLCANKFGAIANKGFIAVPTKWRELTRFSYETFLGYEHHKWIFTIKKGLLFAFPKLGLLEHCFVNLPNLQRYFIKYKQDDHTEMTFMYNDELRIQTIHAWDYRNSFNINKQFAKTMLELSDDLDFIL